MTPVVNNENLPKKIDDNTPIAVREETTQFLSMLERVATNPDVDVTKMNAMLDMKFRMLKYDAELAFNKALALASAEMPRISKKGEVYYEKNGKRELAFKHSKYEDIDKAIRPIMQRHGLSLSFRSEARQGDGGGLVVTGILMHRDGYNREASMPLPLDSSGGKNNLQGYGSSLSYGKRYVASMLLNIVSEDDNEDDPALNLVISTEQVKRLNEMIEEHGFDKQAFLKLMQVDAVAQITQKNFPTAVTALMKKLKAKDGAKNV